MDTHGEAYKLMWTLLASFAGSVTALSFRPYKNMRPIDIGIALFAGFAFATFVGPAVADRMMHGVDAHMQSGIYYMMATGWNILIPALYRRWFGLDKGPGE